MREYQNWRAKRAAYIPFKVGRCREVRARVCKRDAALCNQAKPLFVRCRANSY